MLGLVNLTTVSSGQGSLTRLDRPFCTSSLPFLIVGTAVGQSFCVWHILHYLGFQ